MEIKIEKSYWPNAIGIIGVAFAIAFALRGCSNIMIEKEKTRQLEIINNNDNIKKTKND